MLIWDDARIVTRKFCQDNSVAGVEFQDLMMNVGYKKILVELGRQVTEVKARLTDLAGDREAQVPPDCMWPKSMELIDGTTRTPITEEPSDVIWTSMISSNQQGKPYKFHYRPRFGVGGGILEFEPIPSSDAYIVAMTYEASERDLSQLKTIQGTVSLTRGDDTVTGSGTNFVTDMVGRYLCLGGSAGQRLWYRIANIQSDTQLRLEQYYHGNNVSDAGYTIAEIFALPEDCHLLPPWYAAWQWWATKGNIAKSREFEGYWTTGLAQAKKTHALTTRDNTVDQNPPMDLGIFTQYPNYYPQSVI